MKDPEKFLQYFLYLARFWGRALLFILSGVVLVVIGGNNLNGGPTLVREDESSEGVLCFFCHFSLF